MKVTQYVPGTPCWIDLGSPDLDASVAFYSGLFGWTAHRSDDPNMGGYTIFNQGDSPVAGLGGLMAEGAPPAWAWYAATDDIDATAARVEGSGGKVMAAPMDIPGTGRMAVFMDCNGAPFSAWQATGFRGAELVNEPGAFAWSELMVRDTDSAADFYGKVLGWAAQAGDQAGMPYTLFQIADRPIAGMMPMTGDRWPADLPSHWLVYLAVADTDQAAGRIRELGGTISVPPTDTPAGRFAVAADPTGAVFGIITLT
jgi:hypothetical protein